MNPNGGVGKTVQQDTACSEVLEQLPRSCAITHEVNSQASAVQITQSFREGRSFTGIQAQKKGLQISEPLEGEAVEPWSLF